MPAPVCLLYPDPLAPAAERLPRPRGGEDLRSWLQRCGQLADGAAPPGVVVDGKWWDGYGANPGLDRAVRIEVFPAVGSGLRRSISRRLGFDLLGIALTGAAVAFLPGALGFSAAAGASSFAIAAVQAAVAVGTGLVLNAIAPLATDGLGALPEASGGGSAPAYEISGGSNRLRPYEPLPLLLGTMRFAPDLVAASSAFRTLFEAEGGGSYIAIQPSKDITQVWRHIYTNNVAAFWFCVGARQHHFQASFTDEQGINSASRIDRFGDDNIATVRHQRPSNSTFLPTAYDTEVVLGNTVDKVDYRYVPAERRPGGPIDFSEINTEAYIYNVPPGTYMIEMRFSHIAYRVGSSGPQSYPISSSSSYPHIFYRVSQTFNQQFTAGVQILSHPTSPTSESYTTVLLNFTNSINPQFAAAGATLTIARGSYVNNRNYVIRCRLDFVHFFTVAGREFAPAAWEQGFRSGPAMESLMIAATARTQGRLPQMSGLYSSAVAISSDTSRIANSSNPAWLFNDFALGEYAGDVGQAPTDPLVVGPPGRLTSGTLKWGVGLTAEQIDLDSIRAWGAFCDEQQLECNMVLRNLSRAEALRAIAATGRASPTWHTGKLGVIWDDRRAPSAVFGRGNILPGTFSISYAPSSLADEIKVQWTSADNDYEERSYRVCRPGLVGAPARTTTVRLIGITRDDQARREARRQAAIQQYHRAVYSWETDEEGLLVERGDVVMLPAHIGEWDTSGHLLEVNDAGDQLTLAAGITMPADTAGAWLGLRFANGAFHEVAAEASEGTVTQLRLAAPIPPAAGLPAAPAPGASEAAAAAARAARNAAIRNVAYLLQAVPVNEARTLVKVMEIRPQGGNRVRLTARPEDGRYYDAAEVSDTYPNPPPAAGSGAYTWGDFADDATRLWANWTAWHGRPSS